MLNAKQWKIRSQMEQAQSLSAEIFSDATHRSTQRQPKVLAQQTTKENAVSTEKSKSVVSRALKALEHYIYLNGILQFDSRI